MLCSTNLLLPKVFSITIDNSRVILQIVASLTDNSIGIIYDHNMFIVQATALYNQFYYFKFDLKSILRSFCVNGNSIFKSAFSFFYLELVKSSSRTNKKRSGRSKKVAAIWRIEASLGE